MDVWVKGGHNDGDDIMNYSNHDWSKKIFKYGNPEKEVKINTKERLLRQLE